MDFMILRGFYNWNDDSMAEGELKFFPCGFKSSLWRRFPASSRLCLVGSSWRAVLRRWGRAAALTRVSARLVFPRDIDKCELSVKDLYSKLGLRYRESSSEDEDSATKAMEVIEIPDEDDDDVMSVDLGWKHSSVSHCFGADAFLSSFTVLMDFFSFLRYFKPILFSLNAGDSSSRIPKNRTRVSWRSPGCRVLPQGGLREHSGHKTRKGSTCFLSLSSPPAAGSHGCHEKVHPGHAEIRGRRQQENERPGRTERWVCESILRLQMWFQT